MSSDEILITILNIVIQSNAQLRTKFQPNSGGRSSYSSKRTYFSILVKIGLEHGLIFED